MLDPTYQISDSLYCGSYECIQKGSKLIVKGSNYLGYKVSMVQMDSFIILETVSIQFTKCISSFHIISSVFVKHIKCLSARWSLVVLDSVLIT